MSSNILLADAFDGSLLRGPTFCGIKLNDSTEDAIMHLKKQGYHLNIEEWEGRVTGITIETPRFVIRNSPTTGFDAYVLFVRNGLVDSFLFEKFAPVNIYRPKSDGHFIFYQEISDLHHFFMGIDSDIISFRKNNKYRLTNRNDTSFTHYYYHYYYPGLTRIDYREGNSLSVLVTDHIHYTEMNLTLLQKIRRKIFRKC